MMSKINVSRTNSSITAFSQSQTSVSTDQPATGPAVGASFQAALTKFQNHLTGKELTEFKATTYDGLCNEIALLQQEQESLKSMMNLSRIQSFIEAMDQFGKVVEIFLNVSDAVAFVWGPVKLLLLTTSTFTDAFEMILDAYEQIGEQLPLLVEYESLFHANPHMLKALEMMYIDILDFHQHAIRFVSGKLWKRFFRSLWKDFNTKFDGILKSLRRHKALVESRASLTQYRMYQEDVTEIKAKVEQLIDEERTKKKTNVKDWLAVDSPPECDHEIYRLVKGEYPGTGNWIAEIEAIKHWLDADVPSTPLLWMTGIPGAGKTILASVVIDECKQRKDFLTSYYYCHYSEAKGNAMVGVLKGLVDQLLDQYPQLLPHCYTRRTNSGGPSLQSIDVAKKLLEDFCTAIPKLFIVVDGLDEYDAIERKQLLECFMQLVRQCDDDEPAKLRFLIVSQDYPDIKRALYTAGVPRLAPKIISLSSSDNEKDIYIFVRAWVDRIKRKHHPLSDEQVEYLLKLTVAKADGMFLYAKLVMSNLHEQPTRGDLLDAIQAKNFPQGLGQAYERIVTRIKQTTSPKEWEKAKHLLGYMVCAKRQLTWKEIQVALSIEVDEQTIDYEDRRLRKHIYDICGSLVLLSGDRVQLVHSTAKYYITRCTNDIHEPSVECELATLCLRYLTFPCFQQNEDVMDKHMLQELTMEGHLGFQDYAIAKWFHHVNAFVDAGKDLLKRESEIQPTLSEQHRPLEELAIALEDFTERYSEEDWHEPKKLVAECAENCKIFEDQEFYENLVAVTSHIYTFQKKGFDARHIVSIKSLAAVLDRNRTLLEGLPSKLNPQQLATFKQFYDDERRFKCPKITCKYFSEGFKDAKTRKRHVNIHERPFNCEVSDCIGAEYGFANSKDLEKHTRSFHPEMSDLAQSFNTAPSKRKTSEHKCTLCNKSFTRRFILQNHEMSHRGIRKHACPECGKAFTRMNDMKRHQKLHDRR